jgi:DDE superfamily endonuclease/Winged helix-turn helix
MTAPGLVFITLWASFHLLPDVPADLRGVLALSLLAHRRGRGTATRWTLRGLQRWVQEHFGHTYCIETLRQALHRLGWSWKKARKLLARANTLARLLFLRQLEPLLAQAQRGQLVLAYIDEAHIHCDCDLGYAWGPRGLPLWIHSTSPGLSYKASFYGLYLFPLGRVHIWPAPCANTEHTLEMLTRLRQDYPEQRLKVIWDGASYHRAGSVREHAARLGITLLPLPGYSPDLMPVEALWRWLRQEVTGNHCHASVAELLDRVAHFACLINLDPEHVTARLALKRSLDSAEEELRIWNWI